METDPSQLKVSNSNFKKYILLILLGFVLACVFYIAMKVYSSLMEVANKQPVMVKTSDDLVFPAFESEQSAENTDPSAAETVDTAIDIIIDTTKYVIEKGSIKWQKPKDMGDLGLTSKRVYAGGMIDDNTGMHSGGVRYLKVGDVVEGHYAGAEVIDIFSWIFESPSAYYGPDILRILKFNKEFIFLAKNIDKISNEFIKDNFFAGNSAKKINDGIVIEELLYPETLKGRNNRENFSRNEYDNAFFTTAKLRPIFVHLIYGQAWITDIEKAVNTGPTPVEFNSHSGENFNYESDVWEVSKKKEYVDIFGRGGVYFQAPDGTAVSYKFIPDIFKEERYGFYSSILNATWNDGQRNDKGFEQNPRSCGGGDYVYDETLKINSNTDLVVVGKTDKGDDLYGYRDTSLPGFSKLYNETYWVGEGNKKDSPEEFLKKHPKVFWKDPFGRILAFYNSEFTSPGECGKPVIYLYPEKPMNVSVQVKPGNGLSYTEPKYGNGWNVFADTKSNLKNLVDGKTYPYLFWEGTGSVYYEMPKLGFVVENKNLEVFFDEKLAKLGLIKKEINDFKEFWIPKMQEINKPYYFVTFLSRRFIDQLAPLTVDPKPDTVIRILMDWKGLDAYQKANEFSMKTPERKGFTVVEWGGMLK